MRMKMLLWTTTSLLLVAITAHATGEGPYLGMQAGRSNIHNLPQKNYATGSTVNPSNTGFGARLFLGYNVNDYVGFEGGYTYYGPSTYSTNVQPCDPKIREYAYDLVAKGQYPFGHSGFDLFAKAGISLINKAVSGTLTSPAGSSNCTNDGGQTTIRPVVGLGASYDLNQSWVVDLSVTRVLGGSGIQNADLYAVGLSYHLVNARCGQFLC